MKAFNYTKKEINEMNDLGLLTESEYESFIMAFGNQNQTVNTSNDW